MLQHLILACVHVLLSSSKTVNKWFVSEPFKLLFIIGDFKTLRLKWSLIAVLATLISE